MKILVLYHGDADGIISAAVVKYAYQTEKYLDTEFTFKQLNNSDYHKDFDVEKEFEGFDRVYLVDFSFPVESLLKAKELLGENFIWIDHHKTAILNSRLSKESFAGIQSTSEAACMLCWQYFYGTLKKAPLLVEGINKWDNWRKDDEWESFTYPLNLCVVSLLSDLDSFDIRFFVDNTLIKEMVEGIGTNLYCFLLSQCQSQFSKLYEKQISFAGQTYKALILNSTQGGSLVHTKFEEATGNSYDVHVRYSLKDDFSVECSIYSKKGENCFDCGLFASQFEKGGGHTNAAGFTCGFENFKNLFT